MNLQLAAYDIFLMISVIIIYQVSAKKDPSFDKDFEICYPDIGYFSKSIGPFNWTNVNPLTPDEIGSRFLLYKNQHKTGELHYLDRDLRNTSLLDGINTLTVVIHGMGETQNSKWIVRLRNALVNKGNNVIILDWSKGSKKLHLLTLLELRARAQYLQSVVNTEVVGRELAKLLDLLRTERDLKMANVHIIGFSLGAHVAGFAGKALNHPEQKIGRITGLDPSGPIWSEYGDDVHLSKNDALFIDIIHTSAGKDVTRGHFGIQEPIGHADFYPNGGKEQPGCPMFPIQLTCKHKRSHQYYLESMTSNEATLPCQFYSYPTSSYTQFKKTKNLTCKDEMCAFMGHFSRSRNPGTFFLETNSQSPYCRTIT